MELRLLSECAIVPSGFSLYRIRLRQKDILFRILWMLVDGVFFPILNVNYACLISLGGGKKPTVIKTNGVVEIKDR